MCDLTTADGFELTTGDADNVSRWTKKGDRLYINDLDGNFDAGYVDLQTGEMEDTDYHIKSTEVTVDGDTMTIEFEGKCYGDSFSKAVVVAVDWGETDEEQDDDDQGAEANDVETAPAVDPETHEVEDGVEAGAEVVHDGERKTIKGVGRSNIRFEDGSTGLHEDCDLIVSDTDDDCELVTDGGQDVAVATDAEIENAIEKKDDLEHPDAATVDEVRSLLAAINADIVEWWNEHSDVIDDGGHEIVYEDSDTIVLADHTDHFWNEQFDALDVDDEVLRGIISYLHHKAARGECDYSWSASYPVVVRKPASWQAGEGHVLREIARRTAVQGSASRGLDQYAVQAHGYSQRLWADLSARNESTVSRTVRGEQ